MDTSKKPLNYRANPAGPEDVLTLQAPLSVTRADVEQAEWPTLREALLDNIRATYGQFLDEILARKGWRPGA